jgi:crossover junction endodeoxyribonuclease RuvC
VGIVSGVPGSTLTLDGVGVIMTDTDIDLDLRLLELHSRMTEWVHKYSPDVMAVERVFSQHNVRTVMGTAQAAGIALLVAAQNNIPVFLHTPSEVKAAVTGSGRANKAQVSEMVKRLLNLQEIPKPADSADALALAICHIWRGAGESKIKSALAAEKKRLATLR